MNVTRAECGITDSSRACQQRQPAGIPPFTPFILPPPPFPSGSPSSQHAIPASMMTAGPSPASQSPFPMPNITPGPSATSQLPIVTPNSTAAPSAMISKLYPSHLGPGWSHEARAAQEAQSVAHLQKVNWHRMKVAAHCHITVVLYYKACSFY